MTTPHRVLVTGGSGFLGQYICKELKEHGYDVYSFSRRPQQELRRLGVHNLAGDLNNPQQVSGAVGQVDSVIHTAAKAGVWGPYSGYEQTNVQGTQHMLQACQKHGIRNFIYTSSPSVVFSGQDICGKSEAETSYPDYFYSSYSKTKMLAEKLVLAADQENFHTTALRPHLIWGPKDPHFIPRLIEKSQAKKLFRVGKQKNKVDVIYVENAAFAHVLALEQMRKDPMPVKGKAYFLGQDQPVELWSFLDKMLHACHQPEIEKTIPKSLAYGIGFLADHVYGRLPFETPEPPMTRFTALQLAKSHFFSHQRARKDFAYYEKVSTEEGLERLQQWVDSDSSFTKYLH